MDETTAALLRSPFPTEAIGKLPRVWCKACNDARKHNRGPTCEKHERIRCDVCRNNITSAHLHLDYVGHAEVTDRLLAADPEWTWEPLAFDEQGLPAFDRNGGLWIKLIVAGVTRLGYGDAQGKEGPDAVKECIGDALRNAAMRFGVGVDLWGASYKDGAEQPTPTGHQVQQPRQRSPQQQAADGATALLEAATRQQLDEVAAKVPTSGVAGQYVTHVLDGDDRTALGDRIGAKVTLEDLAAALTAYWLEHGRGPRQPAPGKESAA